MSAKKFTTEQVRNMYEFQRKVGEEKANADKQAALIQKSSQALSAADAEKLEQLGETLKENVVKVDDIVLEAIQLRKDFPNKSANWHTANFPETRYRFFNNRIVAARRSMKAILQRYTGESVLYPDPEYKGLVTTEKWIKHARIHPSVQQYYDFLEDNVTVLKKDMDEFISKGGKIETWMPPV